MTVSGDRIGIIAGSGQLPLHVARCLSEAGKNIYVAGLHGAADLALDGQEWETAWYEAYSLEQLLEGLREAGITKVALAGRVGHDEIYSTSQFDDLLKSFIDNLRDRRPSTILSGLVDLLASNNFEVLPLTEIAPDLLPAAGLMAGPPPTRQQVADIQLGWRVARAIADLDIGQTAVVKNGAVAAVEAMEGTDKAITRAFEIAGGGITVVKLAATEHDFRYDVPTVGPGTIVKIGEAGGGLIVVEAGRSFLLDARKVSALCSELGISLVSARETDDGVVHWPGI